MRPLDRMLRPLRRRLAVLVARSVVRLVDDARNLQELQLTVLADETIDGVERFQEYGFTSRPHPGAEAIALAVGGHRAHTIVVAADDRRYRKKDLAAGECALYTDEGDYIHLKRGRIVEVVAGTRLAVTAPEVEVQAATSVQVNSPTTTITGELVVQGQIVGQAGMAVSGGGGASVDGDLQVSNGDVDADGISLKTHTHPGDSGGTTGEPQ